MLASASELGTQGAFLSVSAGVAEVGHKAQETLVTMAEAVAMATAGLLAAEMNRPVNCSNQVLYDQLTMAVKRSTVATQRLVACTKVCI